MASLKKSRSVSPVSENPGIEQPLDTQNTASSRASSPRAATPQSPSQHSLRLADLASHPHAEAFQPPSHAASQAPSRSNSPVETVPRTPPVTYPEFTASKHDVRVTGAEIARPSLLSRVTGHPQFAGSLETTAGALATAAAKVGDPGKNKGLSSTEGVLWTASEAANLKNAVSQKSPVGAAEHGLGIVAGASQAAAPFAKGAKGTALLATSTATWTLGAAVGAAKAAHKLVKGEGYQAGNAADMVGKALSAGAGALQAVSLGIAEKHPKAAIAVELASGVVWTAGSATKQLGDAARQRRAAGKKTAAPEELGLGTTVARQPKSSAPKKRTSKATTQDEPAQG